MDTNRDEYAEYLALPIGATIQSPGKFEGGARYVPEFWDVTLDGTCDEIDEGTFEVIIHSEDRARYEELEHVTAVYLSSDDLGFIYSATIDEAPI